MAPIFYMFYFWILAIFSQQWDHVTDCMEHALIFRTYDLIPFQTTNIGLWKSLLLQNIIWHSFTYSIKAQAYNYNLSR